MYVYSSDVIIKIVTIVTYMIATTIHVHVLVLRIMTYIIQYIRSSKDAYHPRSSTCKSYVP